MDLFLLHHLKEGIRVNLAHIIICHIGAAAAHPSRSLPYGSLLTAILLFFSFDLEGTRPKKLTTLFNTSTFTSIGFKQNHHGQWVRKNVVDGPNDDNEEEGIGGNLNEDEHAHQEAPPHAPPPNDPPRSDPPHAPSPTDPPPSDPPLPTDPPPTNPPPPTDTPPFDLPPHVPHDSSAQMNFKNQVYQRLDRLDQRLNQMANQWDALFGPSSAFYAAYGPHASRPSSSTAPPPKLPMGHDEDNQVGDDED